MLIVTTVTFGLGAIQKAPCANRAWVERGEDISFFCDTDIPHLYQWEQLGDGRLPYLDPCREAERPCDEYPAFAMYTLRAVASVAGSGGDPYGRFYAGSVLVLLLCALAIAWCLERLGARTILFAAAPVLLTVGTSSWDLFPVALATGGTILFLLLRSDIASGFLLGLGAAFKLYPGALVVPFGAQRVREHAREKAARLAASTALTWLIWNVPFVLLSFAGWYTFFRFNSRRPPDFDSLWLVACKLHVCAPGAVINIGSIALAALGTWWVWRRTTRSRPDLPLWIMGFPMLVTLLLTGKVWSSQYSLWLLPWFAMTSVPPLLFIEYQIAEVAEFLIRYQYFGTLISGQGVPYWVLGVTVVVRAALLTRCLAAWMREPVPVITIPGVTASTHVGSPSVE
jgi:Glycosyltransferase family 87